MLERFAQDMHLFLAQVLLFGVIVGRGYYGRLSQAALLADVAQKGRGSEGRETQVEDHEIGGCEEEMGLHIPRADGDFHIPVVIAEYLSQLIGLLEIIMTDQYQRGLHNHSFA